MPGTAVSLAKQSLADSPPFFSTISAAALLDLHPETIRRAVRSGELPAAKTAGERGRIRISRDALARWAGGGR